MPNSCDLVSQVYFWEYQLRNETERLRTLFLPELGVKLKNLTGYTTYMISVAAFNAAGDGPRSLPTRGRTQQAGGSRQIQLWWIPAAALRQGPGGGGREGSKGTSSWSGMEMKPEATAVYLD